MKRTRLSYIWMYFGGLPHSENVVKYIIAGQSVGLDRLEDVTGLCFFLVHVSDPFSRFGIWAGNPVYAPTGDAITLTQMPLSLW